jgi:hypothetical protein
LSEHICPSVSAIGADSESYGASAATIAVGASPATRDPLLMKL